MNLFSFLNWVRHWPWQSSGAGDEDFSFKAANDWWQFGVDWWNGGGRKHGHAAPFDNGHKSPLGSNNFTPPLGWWKAFRQMTSGEGVTKKWCVIEITADLITAHKRQSSFYDVVAVWTLLERLSTTKRWFFFSSKLRNEWKIDEYCGKNPKLNYNCGLVELAAISRIFFFLISNEIIPLIF